MTRSLFWSRLTTFLVVVVAATVLTVNRQNNTVVQAGWLEQEPAGTDATTHLVNYQGRLANPSTGAPKADGSYSMTFRIYDAATGGTIKWTEIKDVTVSKGLFSTLLGDTTALPSSVFNGNDRWLGVKVGADAETTPRMRLAFTPHASYALNAGKLAGQTSGFYRNANNINAGTLADGRIAGTLTRDSEVVGIVTANDGAGSGIDADLLDGRSSASFVSTSGDSMTANNATSVLSVLQKGTGHGVQGETVSTGNSIAGVHGIAGLAGITIVGKAGVMGQSDSGTGMIGISKDNNGIFGWSTNDYAIEGQGPSTASGGIIGTSFGGAAGSSGVYGVHTASSGLVYGVRGQSSSSSGRGVYGYNSATTGTTYGVYGQNNTSSSSGAGVYGDSPYVGVWGNADRYGVYGRANNTSSSYGVYGSVASGTGYAGYFNGKVHVAGTLSKSSGSFKIDHPLDPENKYLYHSFVESPDMMNVYNGNVVLDGLGTAWVDMPDYFQALNRDFRYQLTAIGGPGPNLHISQGVDNNRFQIAGGSPGLEVSWQVTGIRQDAYANANRIVVEEEKPADERGTLLHPEAFGRDRSLGLDYQRDAALNDPNQQPSGRTADEEQALPEMKGYSE